jgi:LPS export ABC transporter permease LptG
VITVAVALLYWTGFIGFVNLAKQGKLPAEVALWVPNAVLLAMGLWLVARMEKPTERDVFGGLKRFGERLYGRVRGNLPNSGPSIGRQIGVGGQIIDYYVLSTFVFYFVLLLVSFVVMTEVYTFFELLGDILKNNIALSTVAKYLFYLAPKLVYDSTPMSVLVAVLVTFGVMTKNNEVTAIKACGISLYRLAVPVLLASTALSGALFAFDHYVVPDANRIQDGLRAQIKGRPVQTYLRPDRKWIRGEGSRIYYYKYFEPNEGVMLDINVYDLHPQSFRLQRHISAERARWEPSLNSWIFQNGWSREFKESSEVGLRSFQGQTATFPELNEPPHYFLKEVKQDKQMNFQELAAYIDELRQSGFDTIRLQVQFHKKFAVPLFAAIMALLSVPFAFLAAHRGAMAGVGVSFGIAMAYWMVNQVFEQVGYVNQLPAAIAAWAPDAVFTLGGLYFLARMKT